MFFKKLYQSCGLKYRMKDSIEFEKPTVQALEPKGLICLAYGRTLTKRGNSVESLKHISSLIYWNRLTNFVVIQNRLLSQIF